MHYTPVGQRCPEHAGQPTGVKRAAAPLQRAVRGSSRTNTVTMILITINVAVYLAELAIGGSINGTDNWIYEHGALFSSGIFSFGQAPMGLAHGEWWRLITAAFLHYGPFHLLVNMYSLYFAGTLLEQVIGRWRFLLLYLGSGIAGSAGAIFISPNSVTVGASGAIFGILGGLFVLERRRHLSTGGQIAGLIVLNLVFTFAVPNISIGGHLGGLIGGVVIMWVMLLKPRSALYSVAATVGVIAVSIVVAYAKARGYS